jgi:ABC-type antimicrobial peptide transport system permease subunit
MEIIGIARDIKYYSLAEEPRPYVYRSAAQEYSPDLTLHLRAMGDPKALTHAVQKEIESLDPNIAIANLSTFAELRQAQLFPSRAMAIVSSLFGLLALLLAGVGIYGITSYMVGQRTREVGIRIALGAQRSDILRLIVGQGVLITLIGVGVGLGAALALTRLLSSELFGVSATDGATFVGVSIVLIVVAFLACYLPAQRAMKVDPMIALRYE